MAADGTILVADDDRAIRTVLTQALGRLGYDVRTTGHAATLWRWVADGEGDLVITDVVMPDENGLDLVPRIRKLRPELRVIVMSAQNTLLTAVKATERGAFEYLPKPFDLKDLVATVERALMQPRGAAPAPATPEEEQEKLPLIGRSQAMQEIYRVLARLMGTDLTVMIAGESGTGKELVARAIHDASTRNDRPLIRVNCAAIPRELFESEIFGHVRGAFTGAIRDRVGRFELAHGGTLLLDEVGEIPLELQGKLLRVLQEGEFERVGEERTRRVDVRVIAATNRDLRQEVRARRFREDLFYRLNVFPIESRPLRERREDIPLLASHFLRQASERMRAGVLPLTEGDARRLSAYGWPGNVRELENLMERAVILARDGRPNFELPAATVGTDVIADDEAAPGAPVLTETERRDRDRANIRAALRASGGKVFGPGGAAQILGVKPTTLASRIRSLGLRPSGDAQR